jgi:hypothetical protein
MSTPLPATRVRAALAVAVALAASGLAARAQAAFAPAAPQPNLEIVTVGPPGAADLLSVAIAPLMTELEPITWRQLRETTPISEARFEPRAGGVRIWIDAHRAGAVTVVGFSRRGAPRVRSVEAPELTPVVAETIGQIVRETAVALLADPAGQDPPAQERDDETTEPKAFKPSRSRVAIEEAPRAETPAEAAPPPLVNRVMGSISFGFVLRSAESFSSDSAEGMTLSLTAWLQHEAVRSFATLSIDRLEAPQVTNTLYALSFVPTFGIAWRPEAMVDFRTALGVGADRMNSFGYASWYPVVRGAVSANLLLPRRLEATVALTLDVVAWSDFSQRAWQPGLILGLGWRP